MTQYTKVITNIYQNYGVRGFFKGYWSTFFRDVPSYGMFFAAYAWLLKKTRNENDSKARAYTKRMLVAGLAGFLNWIPTYPLDVMKSIIQTHEGPETPRIKEVAIEGYKRNGFRFFFLGLSSCALMAFPTHILVMVVYEYLSGQ